MSSLVSARLVNPFTILARRKIVASNQPQRLGLPVVAPYSWPSSLMRSPSSSKSSVGKGPFPTRVVYALVTPMTSSMRVGQIPVPVQAPPAVVLEDVTNGYVP